MSVCLCFIIWPPLFQSTPVYIISRRDSAIVHSCGNNQVESWASLTGSSDLTNWLKVKSRRGPAEEASLHHPGPLLWTFCPSGMSPSSEINLFDAIIFQ